MCRVTENIRLVDKMLNKHFMSAIKSNKYEYDDLHQIGTIGLINAVKTFDESKYKFSTYACTCIRNEILKSFQSDNAEKRKADVLSLDVVSIKDNKEYKLIDFIEDPDNIYEHIETNDYIEYLCKDLKSKEYKVIKLMLDDMLVKDIAKEIGIAYQHVNWLRRKAFNKIRGVLQ